MLNQDFITLFAFAPIVALFVFVVFKMFDHFRW